MLIFTSEHLVQLRLIISLFAMVFGHEPKCGTNSHLTQWCSTEVPQPFIAFLQGLLLIVKNLRTAFPSDKKIKWSKIWTKTGLYLTNYAVSSVSLPAIVSLHHIFWRLYWATSCFIVKSLFFCHWLPGGHSLVVADVSNGISSVTSYYNYTVLWVLYSWNWHAVQTGVSKSHGLNFSDLWKMRPEIKSAVFLSTCLKFSCNSLRFSICTL